MQSQAQAAQRRSQTYWLLSRLFLEQPATGLLQELSNGLRAEGVVSGGRDELAQLRSAVDTALTSPHALLALQVEFTRLLRGLSKTSGAPEPYESMAREGRLFGESTEAVAAVYAAAGYENLIPDAGPPDHLATELRFMSVLCYEELQAWRRDDEANARLLIERELGFLDQHVLPWVPAFCEQLAGLAIDPFYLAVATLTANACRLDREDIALADADG